MLTSILSLPSRDKSPFPFDGGADDGSEDERKEEGADVVEEEARIPLIHRND